MPKKPRDYKKAFQLAIIGDYKKAPHTPIFTRWISVTNTFHSYNYNFSSLLAYWKCFFVAFLGEGLLSPLFFVISSYQWIESLS